MSLTYITNGQNLYDVVRKHIRRLRQELKVQVPRYMFIAPDAKYRRWLNNYLIDNNFLDFEGDTVDDDSITAFIYRLQHDDRYLKKIKHTVKTNAVDKYDDFIRDRLSKQFSAAFDDEQSDEQSDDEQEPNVKQANQTDAEQQEKEKQIEESIKKARDALDQAIQAIKDLPILLRPLPPRTNNPLKRYVDERFNNENQELIRYLDTCGYKGFQSHHDKWLMVNEPHDSQKALRKLIYFDKYDNEKVKIRTDKDNERPIVSYYFNKLKSLDDVYNGLEKIFKTEIKPFKINTQMTGVFETPKDDDTYEYETRDIKWWNYKGQIPIIVRLPEDIDKVKLYIESKLHEYETTTSNTKLTIISSVSFTVSRMIRVTGRVELPKELMKQKAIIIDNVDDKLCWYRFLAICLNNELADTKKYNVVNRTKVAKKLLLKNHGIEYNTKMTKKQKTIADEIINGFKGMTLYDMRAEAEQYQLNIRIYEYIESKKQFNLTESWKNNESNDYHSAVVYANETIFHIMFIKPYGVESLTNILICPRCSYTVSKSHPERMKKHLETCNGELNKKLVKNNVSLPYIPHILNNPIYEYCLAHGIEWKPSIHYITYDFETMEHKVDEQISDSTTINSRMIPLTVASCAKLDSRLVTKHFDIRTTDFIAEWIEWLFDVGVDVYHDKLLRLQSFIDKSEKELLKLEPHLKTITVFGFNSSRFDSNLFKDYFNHRHWVVEGLIGTTSSLKQFILVSSKYDVKLRFVDAQAFVAGGSLKQFGVDFGGCDNSDKGVFPYEAINDKNYNEVLSKSEPFDYDDFYSYLNQKNPLTKTDYEEYVRDSKRFRTRWDYLLSYNDNDVEMMIKPLDNLIQLNAEYNVDLINNLSLSKNASCIKYALAYNDFDINHNYGVVNNETTFKPDRKWFQHKCERYRKQDELYNDKLINKIKTIEKEITKQNQNDDILSTLKSKMSHLKNKFRDINRCVSINDYDSFIKRYETEDLCYLCGEHFTHELKPTLDRIDNDIGHELTKCGFACQSCNVLRNRKDSLITRLRIQLKKYCLSHQ